MIFETLTETQYSVFMVNKPGVLSQILLKLAHQKINIVAMMMSDSAEHGVMRLITSDKDKTKELLNSLNMQFSETVVICVRLPNRPGSLGEVTQKLADHNINISYAYCTAGGKGGKAIGILKVANVAKALKILEGYETKTKAMKRTTVKRTPVK